MMIQTSVANSNKPICNVILEADSKSFCDGWQARESACLVYTTPRHAALVS